MNVSDVSVSGACACERCGRAQCEHCVPVWYECERCDREQSECDRRECEQYECTHVTVSSGSVMREEAADAKSKKLARLTLHLTFI